MLTHTHATLTLLSHANLPDGRQVHTYLGEIPERSNGADCKSVGEAFGGSNPPLPTSAPLHTHTHFAEVAHLVERKPSKLQVAGSSPVFRSTSHPHPLRRCSSVVEHFLGKEGVMSSTLIIGSTSINKKVNCN